MPTHSAHYLRRGKATVSDGTGVTPLPQVQALSSQWVHDAYGINMIPNGGTTVYQTANHSVIFSKLSSLGVKYIRGLFDQNNSHCLDVAAYCASTGIKWMMEVVTEASNSPTTQTTAQTTTRINYIADHWSNIVHSIEGLNEPNENRGDGSTTAGWQTVALNHQVAIWNACKGARNATALGSVPILLPSLNDKSAAANSGKHYKDLANTGIAAYGDYLGLHRYPSGETPETNLDQRVGLVAAAFGAENPVTHKFGTTHPVGLWLTEWGYHNALASTGGHKPIDEAGSGIYGPRGLLGIAARGYPVVRFEFLDDIDPGPKDVQESNFGIVRVSSVAGQETNTGAWVDKAEVANMTTLLSALNDPGASYSPSTVGVQVTTTAADLRYVVTAKRSGAATIWLWREKSVWNTTTLADISVATTSVTVTDNAGDHTFSVGASVVGFNLT